MDDGTPTLEVGFAVAFGDSFAELARLNGVIDDATANAMKEFAAVERASKSMVNLSGATAQMTSFGNASTREMANATRATNQAEKAGEALVRQLQRQAETYGKTASEIRNMRAEQKALAAEAQGLTELAARVRAANAAMNELERGTGVVTAGAIKNRQAMQGATYQVQDFFTQVSMGANPVNAFAVQGAQLAGQFSNVESKAGDVARFFMGPWGLAITAGLMLLGPFVGKLLEQNSALDDAVDKLKKDARETEVNRQAKAIYGRSIEGVTDALRKNREALDNLAEGNKTAAQKALAAADAEYTKAVAIRNTTVALLEQAKAQRSLSGATITGGTSGAMIARTANEQEIIRLEKQIEAAKKAVAEAEGQVNEAFSRRIVERQSQLADPIERIKNLYEGPNGLIEAARKQASAEDLRSGALGRQIRLLKEREQAAIEAAQGEQRAMRQTAQVGREIDLAEARRIAESIGARITSEQRSYEEQKRLYDKYMAYKAGKGPWAALAAAPGTSDHELGNALDIAKTPGMSLAKIRDAFRAAGVSIKQLLDEGSHFHVSWKKGADSAAAASKKLADVQADLAKKFDPAEAAALEYAAALKSIGEAKLDPATATRYAAEAAEAFRKARAAAFELPSMAGITADATAQKEAEKSATEFQRNVIQPLKDELALYGLVGPARAAAALELEKEAFIAKNIGEGITVATQRWQEYYAVKKQLIGKDIEAESVKRLVDELERVHDAANRAGDGIAQAFGDVGSSIADVIQTLGRYVERQQEIQLAVKKTTLTEAQGAKASAELQIATMGDIAHAAKGMFDERSKAYKGLEAAEKAFRLVQFALSARAIVQDAIETGTALAKSAARAAAYGVEAVAKAISSLPFPLNLAAGAATAAAIAALGISIAGSFGGGGKALEKPNEGTGTVFGDADAKTASIKNAIDALKEVDTLTNTYARQMASSLRSIESQIGGIATLVVRAGDINASAGVTEGFKPNLIGSVLSKIPLIGGILGGLFGSTTTVTGSGLYAGAQSLGSILNGGFDASYYSDIQKKSKFLGITTGTKNSTQYTGADAALEQQFALLLRSFNDAILAAAGPLGAATGEIQNRLNGFIVNIGKIDLKGLTGAQIQEKLSAVFGAAADSMANAAFPGIAQFQKVGEGAFETLVRVASTIEAVGNSLDMLGQSAVGMGVAAKLGLVDQFESVSALTDAAEEYFRTYYTEAEQAAAKTAQIGRVFTSLGVTMPTTLAGFRQLVEAQDLTTAAGQATYATLLKLAPAFADLQESLEGAKSAADIASERVDLQRQLLQLQGNTAALRALDLAKLDASNRALQQQIWAIQDAQEAAKAAEELRQAWKSVGDSIMDEVKRIRGLDGVGGGNSFAALMGQFNAATAAARGGDMDAAKSLPQLSQALLTAAAAAATSQQELARVQAQTAASLEATNSAIAALSASGADTTNAALLAAAAANSAATVQTPANDDLVVELQALRSEVTKLREENNSGHAANASANNKTAKILDNVTQQSGGDAISMVEAA